jgi:hypothetical protein
MPMADEEAAPVVDEHFVERGRHRLVDAEPRSGQRNGPVERLLPVLAVDAHAIRPDLPRAPHVCIDDRRRAPSIGGALCQRDQLLGLNVQERQRDLADAVDRQARRRKLHAAGRKEVARPPDRAQQFRQFSANIRHRHSSRTRRHGEGMACCSLLPNRRAPNPCG